MTVARIWGSGCPFTVKSLSSNLPGSADLWRALWEMVPSTPLLDPPGELWSMKHMLRNNYCTVLFLQSTAKKGRAPSTAPLKWHRNTVDNISGDVKSPHRTIASQIPRIHPSVAHKCLSILGPYMWRRPLWANNGELITKSSTSVIHSCPMWTVAKVQEFFFFFFWVGGSWMYTQPEHLLRMKCARKMTFSLGVVWIGARYHAILLSLAKHLQC